MDGIDRKLADSRPVYSDRVHPLAPARHDEQSLKIADLAQSSNDLMNDYEGRTLYILKVTDSLLWLLWQQAQLLQ
jgi:hypothetical protein